MHVRCSKGAKGFSCAAGQRIFDSSTDQGKEAYGVCSMRGDWKNYECDVL